VIYPNIFVLSTGRCGSTTFFKACSHFTNYSSGHETLSSQLGIDRFSYPSFHIESDNRLSWLLGRLDREYGNSAFYVHLTRDVERTAASFAKRKVGIMNAYQGMGIIMGCKETDQLKIARDYIDTVDTNIKLFLSDKTHKMNFRLERAKEDFTRFILSVNAQGNLQEALNEFDVAHNAS